MLLQIVSALTIIWLLFRPPAFPQAETIAVLPGPALTMTWGVESTQLMIGQYDGSLTVWDLSKSPPESRIIPHGHTSPVAGAAMSPSQTYLAAGFADSMVLVWDLINDTLLYRSRPFRQPVHRVVWSSDSRLVAASGVEISVVNVETAAEIHRIDQWVSTLSWIPDTHLLFGKLASGPGGGVIWDIESGEMVKQLRDLELGLLSPDGKRAGIWDLESEQIISVCLECFVASLSYAWSPDSQRMAVGSGSYLCFEGSSYCLEDFNIRVWNVETDVTPMIFSGHTDDVTDLVWHPDGSKITSASLDNTARIWDTQTGTLMQTFYVGADPHNSPGKLNPDGTMLAVVDKDVVRVLYLAVSPSDPSAGG